MIRCQKKKKQIKVTYCFDPSKAPIIYPHRSSNFQIDRTIVWVGSLISNRVPLYRLYCEVNPLPLYNMPIDLINCKE